MVEAGINDLKAIPLLPRRRDQIVSDCKANLRQIVRRSREGGAVVIVSTIFPPGKVPLERRMVWSPEIEKAVEEVNSELRGVGMATGCSCSMRGSSWKTTADCATATAWTPCT